MEEADALADRFLIVHRGKLCVNEKSNKLKEIYGNGYKLIFRMNSDAEEIPREEFNRWLNEKFPSGIIESETDEQIHFQTNEKMSKEFLNKLEDLDLIEEKKTFVSYGIAQTTLGFSFEIDSIRKKRRAK